MRIAILLVAVVLASCELAFGRPWSDLSGTRTIHADLVDAQDGDVRLRLKDGSILTVEISKLSAADQDFVRKNAKQPVENAKAAQKPPVLVADGDPSPTEGTDGTTDAATSQRFVLLSKGVLLEVTAVGDDPEIKARVRPWPWSTRTGSSFVEDLFASLEGQLTEGHYVAIVYPEKPRSALPIPEGASFLRCEIVEVEKGGTTVALRVDEEALKALGPGQCMLLMRPAKSSTAELRAAPAIAPFVVEPPPSPDQITKVAAASVGDDYARLVDSANRLKAIGLGLLAYHAEKGFFPPAAIHGPDGKPWHSWRVLLLPYLGKQALYDQYRFDEPWDGPNNKKLIEKMPDSYADPVHKENPEYFTHYAVASGEGTAFPPNTITFDGTPADVPVKVGASQKSTLRNFRDGTTMSILVGTIDPAEKIVWSQPADLSFDAKKPVELGEPGGFAAPHRFERAPAGLFLRADGTVIVITIGRKADLISKLLTIADRQPVSMSLVSEIQGKSGKAVIARKPIPVIEIRASDRGPVAKLVRGDAETGESVERPPTDK